MRSTPSTRQAVQDAALRLVDGGGLPAVTIARLTAESGVSTGSIYHHFGSREGVLRSLLVAAFAELTADLAGALDDRTAEECVRDLVHRHLAWVARSPGKAAVLYSVPLDPAVTADAAESDAVSRAKEQAAGPLAAWFLERQERGELRQVPVWALDPIVLGPVHEASRRGLRGDEVEQAVADTVWASLRP